MLQVSIFFLLLSMVSITYSMPFSGYEASLYSNQDLPFWAISFLSFVLIIWYTVRFGLDRIILAAIMGKMIVGLYPLMKGYRIVTGDVQTHLGVISDLLNSGYLAPNSYYPLSYVIMTQVSSLTGISVHVLLSVLTSLVFIVPAVFSYLIVKKIFSDESYANLAFVLFLLIPNLYYINFYPNGWSLLPFPIVLYLLLMRSNLRFPITVLLLIFTIITSLFHPMSGFMLAFFYLLYKAMNRNREDQRPVHWSLVILAGVVFVSWTTSFDYFNANIIEFINNLISNTVSSKTGQKLDAAQSFLSLGIQDYILIGVGLFGFSLILIGAAAFLLLKLRSKFDEGLNSGPLVFIAVYAIILGVLFSLNQSGLISSLSSLGGSRFLVYFMIFAPILIIGFVSALTKHRLLVTAMVAGILMVSLIGLFPSPLAYQTNDYTTSSIIDGYGWTFDYMRPGASIYTPIESPARYADMIYGIEGNTFIRSNALFVGDHFRYDEVDEFGTVARHNSFIVVSDIDYRAYTEVWKNYRFYSDDFYLLNVDHSLNRAYNNGHIVSYQIN